MNSYITRMTALMSLVAMAGSLNVAAETPREPHDFDGQPTRQTTLVPDVRRRAALPDCDLATELERKVVMSSSEKFVMKTLLSATVLSQKYEAVRNTPVLKVTEVPNEAIKKELEELHGRTGMSLSAANVSAAMAFASLMEASSHTGIRHAKYFDFHSKLGVTAGVIGSALASSGFYSSARINALENRPPDYVTVDQERALGLLLDAGVEEPVRQLGEHLEWGADQETRFSRALRIKVLETFRKAVQENESALVDSDDPAQPVPFKKEILSALEKIDFLDVIESENLARPEVIKAMRTLRFVATRGAKLTGNIGADKAKKVLSEETSIRQNIQALVRLNVLLHQVERELAGDSEARAAIRGLIAESDESIRVLKNLCDI
jgi:hypothetical protein